MSRAAKHSPKLAILSIGSYHFVLPTDDATKAFGLLSRAVLVSPEFGCPERIYRAEQDQDVLRMANVSPDQIRWSEPPRSAPSVRQIGTHVKALPAPGRSK